MEVLETFFAAGVYGNFLPVALVFVGLVLITNGMLGLGGADAKSQSVMDWVTGGLMVVGAFIGLMRASALGDFQLCCGFFLFGFTYLILGATLCCNLDWKVYGWYAGLVAIFAAIFGIVCLTTGAYYTAYLWLAWCLLWGWGCISCCIKTDVNPKITPVFCIIEGFLAAFIPGILIFLGKWGA